MNPRFGQLFFQFLLTISLFSLWAGFALLVINKLFYKTLPGYTIGKICIWEFVALLLAALLAKLMVVKWGTIKIELVGNENRLTLHPNYGTYFSIYFLLALAVGVWQFWVFSQQF